MLLAARNLNMNAPLDIFQMIPVDRVLWRGTAGTVEEAQVRVREFAGRSPGKYLILCVQTGTRARRRHGRPRFGGNGRARQRSAMLKDTKEILGR
ncbi:MAG: hypothetical protein WA581_08090 [Candidatus Acidiferrales bacterium]